MTNLLLALALAQPPGYPQPFPGPGLPPPPTIPAPLPVPQAEGFSPLRPIGVETFAKSFVPTPGIHQVWFLHPNTKQAVFVAFVLPENCGVPKVKCGRSYVKFDFQHARDVEVNFRHNGGVQIEY